MMMRMMMPPPARKEKRFQEEAWKAVGIIGTGG
jgi:hypothetical protein